MKKVKMLEETIVCHSYSSFFDMCDNSLVMGKTIHCVFKVKPTDISLLNQQLINKGGRGLTVSSLCQDADDFFL